MAFLCLDGLGPPCDVDSVELRIGACNSIPQEVAGNEINPSVGIVKILR